MRPVYEDKLSDGFISDGSSLQEWFYVVSGSVEERLKQVASLLSLEPRMSPAEATRRASEEYARLDVRSERERLLQ